MADVMRLECVVNEFDFHAINLGVRDQERTLRALASSEFGPKIVRDTQSSIGSMRI